MRSGINYLLKEKNYKIDYLKQKDIFWIDSAPSKCKEIQKRKSALVVSKSELNQLTGFCLVCPITSTRRNYPTYIPIKEPQKISGEVVTHQLRSVDYMTRNFETIEVLELFI